MERKISCGATSHALTVCGVWTGFQPSEDERSVAGGQASAASLIAEIASRVALDDGYRVRLFRTGLGIPVAGGAVGGGNIGHNGERGAIASRLNGQGSVRRDGNLAARNRAFGPAASDQDDPKDDQAEAADDKNPFHLDP